jgi:hypothetical protein
VRGKPKSWVDKPERKVDAEALERRGQVAAAALFGVERADGRCSGCRAPLEARGGPALGAAARASGSAGFRYRYCRFCTPTILRRLGLLEPVAA